MGPLHPDDWGDVSWDDSLMRREPSVETYTDFQEIVDANWTVDEQNALAAEWKRIADICDVRDACDEGDDDGA